MTFDVGDSTNERNDRENDCEDNIKEWTSLEWNIILQTAENREEWRRLVVKSTVVPQRSARLRDRPYNNRWLY